MSPTRERGMSLENLEQRIGHGFRMSIAIANWPVKPKQFGRGDLALSPYLCVDTAAQRIYILRVTDVRRRQPLRAIRVYTGDYGAQG